MRELAQRLYRVLRSSSLAVAVLLALALLAAAGTYFTPPGAEVGPEAAGDTPPLARFLGLQRTFQSPLFLALVALAALNVTACTWHRFAQLRRQRAVRLRALTDLLIHASLLLILTGGLLKGMLGFVGTQNVHVGRGTGTLYDWRTRRDEPLGFEIRVEEFREGFYPIRARIGVLQAGTSEKLGRLEVVEGGVSAGPGGEPSIRLAGYDSAAGVISFSVVSGGVSRSIAFRTQAQEAVKMRAGAYDLVLVSYRADLKEARARVSLVEAGAVVAGGWLSSSTSVSHRGLTLFLTAWGADAEGNRFCGIQGTRDPGAPFFWVGCVLLALAIPGHFFAKGRRSA